MPSTNLQVNFRVSEAEMAAIEAAKPPGMTLGAFAKAATLDSASGPLMIPISSDPRLVGADPGLEVGATTHKPPKKAKSKPFLAGDALRAAKGVCRAHGAVLMAGRDRCSRYDCKG